jgi:response regulator NasT
VADTSLTILVIDENPTRATILEDGLREAGLVDVVRLDTTHELLKRIFEIDPDVILIDLASPSRDALEQMFQVSRTVKRPVAMFVDQSDSAMIESAVDAGVSAYIVDGLRKERVKSILDMTVSRFNAFDRLTRELQQARDELADRKLVERAKGILMKSRGISEEEAYGMLRRTAMNEKVKLADIARSVVTAAQLLG